MHDTPKTIYRIYNKKLKLFWNPINYHKKWSDTDFKFYNKIGKVKSAINCMVDNKHATKNDIEVQSTQIIDWFKLNGVPNLN